MVKFGRFIESHKNSEWQNQYIDYKSLKNKIKELKLLQDRELHELSPTHLRLDKVDNLEDLEMLNGEITGQFWAENLQEELKGKSESQRLLIKQKYVAVGRYINKFLSELDEEVKKFFHFYLQLEKEIRVEFIQLKNQINELSNVESFKQVLTVIESIDQVADKIINVCQYININITAIRKILKKFDKKFETKENPVALHYLKQNLSKSNSSLVYILQFKIVDEASALLDRMINSLEKSFFKKIKFQQQESEDDILLQEPLLIREINLEELSGANIHKNIFKMIEKKFTKIKAKLEKIDDSNNLIRSGIEVWSLIIKSNIRVVDDYFKTKAAVKKSTQADIQGIILEKLTPQVMREEEYHLSLQSKVNLLIVLLHTFVYTMNCYIVQPTNGLYVSELGANKTLSGLIMGLTHLAAIFCTFLYSYWTNYSYKFPLIISCMCFILGNFFYAFAYFEKSLLIMGLGRFLIGLASARVVNRRYIIDQVPKQLIMFFSLLYVGLTCLGMAAGPFIALLLLNFFPNEYVFFEMRFNNMTNPGWFCLILWLVFTLFILFAFKDPQHSESTTSSNSLIESQTHSLKNDSRNNSNSGHVIKLEENKNLSNAIISNGMTSPNTNMFEHDIQEIIHEQESTYSYMNIAFTILILVLLVIRMTTESLMVLTPISTPIHFGISPKIFAWFLSFTAFIVFPITYFVNKLEKKYAERQIIFSLLIACLISCILIANIPYEEASLVRFMVFFTTLFVSCNILESVDSALLAKIFPANLNLGFVNSGFTIILSTTGGKFIGSFLITIIGWFISEEAVYDWIIGFYLILFAILNYLVYKYFGELRVKAIARILHKNQ